MRQQNKSFSKQHPDFITFFDKVAWAAMSLVAAYAANQLSKIGDNVADLNKNIAVVVAKMEAIDLRTNETKSEVKSLDLRVKTLETGVVK